MPIRADELIICREVMVEGIYYLSIEAGGSLTLRNVDLFVNTPASGHYGIRVRPGGLQQLLQEYVRNACHSRDVNAPRHWI